MTRTCDNCGRHLITHRRDARFCDERCKNAWHNKRRRGGEAPAKHFTGAEGAAAGRVGVRKGNIRSVEEADNLHELFKDEWRRRVMGRILHALDTKGEYHADDCADLQIPAEHVNLIGSQVMRLINGRAIKKVGTRRNRSKASNARWSGVYTYAPDGGREKAREIVGLGAGARLKPEPSAESGENRSGGNREAPAPRGPGGSVIARATSPASSERVSDRDGDRVSGASPASVADDLAVAEGRLFESVPLSASSAFHPDNA